MVLNAGKVPFFTYVHRSCIFWIVCYDVSLALPPTKLGLQNRTILPVITSLWLQVTLASTNEWKLLTIDL